jgi:AraC-like ligand binding domain
VAPGDRIEVLSSRPGVERLQALLHGRAFAPHRHDTYAIGITLAGVQRFRFRGAT